MRDRIVTAAGLGPENLVVEIGPGTGILTEAMLRTGASVLAVELDRDLARLLSERLAGNPRFTIRSADALEFDFAQALHDDPRRGRARVVANIPYYITTPLILRLLGQRELFESLFLTVQREVADRLATAPGSKSYGELTEGVQALARVERLFGVKAGSVSPPPRVESAVVRITPLASPLVPLERVPDFRRLVVACFSRRRKQLRNALAAAWGVSPPSAPIALATGSSRRSPLPFTSRIMRS